MTALPGKLPKSSRTGILRLARYGNTSARYGKVSEVPLTLSVKFVAGVRDSAQLALGRLRIVVGQIGLYHPDYREDFASGDNPYLYYRW